MCGALGAAAQNNLQKEVDVTRAYEPSVKDFFKLNIKPDMTDTTQLRPEFNYNITPRPLSYGFAVSPLNPVTVNTIENKELYPIYLKVGAGFPLQSVLDFRLAKESSERTRLGAYLSHYGQYAKIKNDMEIKAPSFQTYNRAGGYIDHLIGNDLSVGGELGYGFTNVTRYGYYNLGDPLPETFNNSRTGLGQFFHNVQANVALGNSFTDLSKFNFKVNVGVDYFADRFKYDQFQWNGGVELGLGVGMNGNVRIKAGYNGTNGMNNLSDASNSIMTAGLLYRFDNGSFRFSLGADYVYDNQKGFGSNNTLLPLLSFEKDLWGGAMTPFVDVTGQVQNNSYGNLTEINPYIMSGLILPNTRKSDARAGIKGTLGKSFKYKVYGGYSHWADTYFFTNEYQYNSLGNTFGALSTDMKAWLGGVELQANIVNALGIYGKFQYTEYDPDGLAEAGDLPKLKADLGLTYNYRNKLYLNLGGTLLGERYFYEYRMLELFRRRADATVDLHLDIDYFITKRFGVFVNLNNLLNQDIYRFNRYKSLGINAMAGIKLSF